MSENGTQKKLRPKQVIALQKFVATGDASAAAEAGGVGRSTFYRWQSSAEWQAALHSAEVDCTLLRRFPPGSSQQMFDTRSTNAYNHTDRNPHFFYQGLQRLGDLVTTRSNVYAVWVTIGYFEVNPSNPAVLVRELGSDTGEVKRHRAFYLFDRSIPVAFEPGRNHNVDDAVLVRTFIE